MEIGNESQSPPAWKMYERLAAFVASQEKDTAMTVVPNAKITGRFSGAVRQIDVLIDRRLPDAQRKRVIVDAKLLSRPLDVKHVEEFEGMMKDVRADHGILVCANGFSAAASRRAQQAINIRLLSPDELDSATLDTWYTCASETCIVHTSGKGKYEGWVLYDEVFHAGHADEPVSPVAVGKCDVCGCFNVWCWECGEIFALPGNEAEARCECSRFWLTSVEEDETSREGIVDKSVYLTAVLIYDGVAATATVSRRPLS
jgi:hypothetical protein